MSEFDFKRILERLSQEQVNSIDQFVTMARLVRSLPVLDLPDRGVRGYLKHQQGIASDRLSTQGILEAVIEGEDLSPLMSVPANLRRFKARGKFTEYLDYRWRTDDPENRGVLHRLRTLGEKMHSDITKPFSESQTYRDMEAIAAEALSAYQDKFGIWKRISAMDDFRLKTMTPAEIADVIFSHTKDETRQKWTGGYAAILYLGSRFPKEMRQKVKGVTDYLILNPPRGETAREVTNIIEFQKRAY